MLWVNGQLVEVEELEEEAPEDGLEEPDDDEDDDEDADEDEEPVRPPLLPPISRAPISAHATLVSCQRGLRFAT